MASLDVIRRLTIQAKTDGVSESAADLNKLSAAQEGVATSSAKQERATLSLDKAVVSLQRRYDQEFRAQQDLAKVQKTLDAARAQGLISQQRSSELMQEAIRFHNTSTQAASGHAKALEELSQKAQSLSGSLGEVGGILSRLGPAGLAIGAALGAMTLGFKAAADAALQLANDAGKLADTADTIGVTFEQLRALQMVGGEVGVDSEKLSSGLEKFASVLGQVREGAQGATDSFDNLSPGLSNGVRNAKTMDQALQLVFQGLQKADTAAAALAARELFGKGGTGFVRIAAAATDVTKLADSVNRLDVVTGEQGKSWDQLGDSISKNMKLASTNVTASFAQPVLKVLDDVSKIVVELSRTFRLLVTPIAEGFATTALEEFRAELQTLNFEITKFGTAAATVDLAERIFGPDFVSQVRTILTQLNAIATALNALTALAGAAGQATNAVFTMNAAKLADATERATAASKQIGASLATVFSSEFGGRVDSFASRFNAATGAFSTNTGAVAAGTKEWFKFGNQMEAVGNIVGESLPPKFGKAGAAAGDAGKKALDFVDILRNNVSALGDAATAAEKYELKVAELAQKLQEGTITQDTFNRAVRQLNPAMQQIQGVVSSLGQAMAQAFINGKNGADALNASLKSIASTAASSAINSLLKGDFASAATSGAISLGSFLASKLFGSSDEDDAKIQEKAEAANQELKGLMTNLEGLTKQFNKLAEVSGGELLDALASAQNQFEEIQRAAIAQSTLAAQDLGVPAEVGNLAAQQAAEALSSALQTLAVIRQREIDKFRTTLRGADPIAEVTQEFRSLNSIASQLVIALQQAGASAEVAAEAIGQDLATGLNRLRTNFVDVLVRQLREVEGKGFLNQMADLIKATEDQRIEAATVGGIDTTLIDSFFIKSAQSIVNQAKLTGAAFEELLQVFPRLRTNVLEFVDTEKVATDAAKALEDAAKAAADAAEAAKQAAEAAAQRAQELADRLFNALTDTTTLEGQLAAFDRKAQQERAEEAKLGGQNLVLLEMVLAAEREKVIKDFNQQAIEAEKKAAEDRMNAINSAAKQIVDFVSGLFAGPQAVLSPMAQLQQAQSNYTAVLQQAQTGNLEAQQQITETAGTFVNALKAVYGSTQVYQQGVQQVASDLLNLPAAAEATDPVVQALRESIAELQNITLNTGNTAGNTAGTVSVVQSVEAQQQQANQTATAQFDQTTLMLHALHLQNTQIQYDQINTNAIINALDQIYANINTTNNLLNQVIVAEYAATPGARGGLVTGGAAGVDSVPLLTMPGEYLVNAKATQRWAPLLRSMNDNGALGELPQMMMAGGDSTLAAEIRSLRSDLARGFVANAEYVREGLDEVSAEIASLTRENALRGQAA